MSSDILTLAEIRRRKGRSIRDLAEHLGIDRGYVARVEAGYYREHEIDRSVQKVLYRFYGPSLYRYLEPEPSDESEPTP